MHRTVAGIGHKERISPRLIADALRLAQSGNCADHTAICEIDDADRVIAKFGDEQSLPLESTAM